MAIQIERVNMNFFGNLMSAIYEKHTSEIKFWRQLRQQSLRKDWKIASKSLFSSLIEQPPVSWLYVGLINTIIMKKYFQFINGRFSQVFIF